MRFFRTLWYVYTISFGFSPFNFIVIYVLFCIYRIWVTLLCFGSCFQGFGFRTGMLLMQYVCNSSMSKGLNFADKIFVLFSWLLWIMALTLLFCYSTYSDTTSVGLVKYRGTYPFGVDPSWRGSRSELPFLNSLKMKMSILFGVAQMNLGIILSYFNARYFSNSLDIKCVIFLFSCTF